jgi:hypothetical protein
MSDRDRVAALPGGGARILRTRRFVRRRLVHGVGATAIPSVAFIAIGLAVGRYGAGLIGPSALRVLDPVTTTALAVLGGFVGLQIGRVRGRDWPRVAGGAVLEVAITTATVAVGLFAFIRAWQLPLALDAGAFALLTAACAAASAGIRVPGRTEPSMRRAAAVADTDDVPLTLLGAVVIAQTAGGDVALRVAGSIAAGAAIGLASALLLRQHDRDRERSVFIAGAVLVAGGAAAYLGTSPLLSGCATGIVWARASRSVQRIAEAELRRFQHPLVALLLVIAGASLQWTRVVPWVVIPVLLLRTAGKLLGGAVAAPVVGTRASLLGTLLLSPGILGIALALNAEQVLGMKNALVITVTVAVVAAAELIALLLVVEEETVA